MPLNFGKRMGQMMAERSDISHMNIIQKTSLWYRLERIGQEPPALLEDRVALIEQTLEHQPDWTRQQFGRLEQLEGRVIHLENKLTEIRAKKKGSYTIQ